MNSHEFRPWMQAFQELTIRWALTNSGGPSRDVQLDCDPTHAEGGVFTRAFLMRM